MRKIDSKQWVSAYICGMIFGGFLCLYGVYLVHKNAPPPEKDWSLIEQSRGEGYRLGYGRGWSDRQNAEENGYKYDDTYPPVELKQTTIK